MRELADLEVDHHVALELDVVENQVGVEVVAVERQPQLPADEREAPAQLQKERLHLADQGLFDARLDQPVRLGQVEEFEDIGVFDCVLRAREHLANARQRQHTLLVAALEQAQNSNEATCRSSFRADHPLRMASIS